MRKGMPVAVLATLLAAGHAVAQERGERFSYSYAELGYFSSDRDDITTNGLGVRASYAIAPQLHLFADYIDLKGEFGPFNADSETIRIGVGVNWPSNRNVDLIGRVAYVSSDVNFNAPGLGGADEDGVGIEAGLRHRASSRLEITGSVEYVRFDGDEDDTSLNLGARYYFDRRWAGAFDIGYSDGNPTFMFGARYDFGR